MSQSTTTLPADAVPAIAKLAQDAFHKVEKLGPVSPQKPVLLWPDKSMFDVEHLLPAPVCKRGSAAMGDAASFAAYVNAHRTEGLVIFGEVTESGGFFTAILDGHVAATLKSREGDTSRAVEIVAPGSPAWGEHVAKLTLAPTPEWTRWLGNNGKPMTQEAFAVFLEENAADVLIPPEEVATVAGFPVPHGQLPNSAQLMSVALTLQTKTEVHFSSKINRQNGQTQLNYVENVSATSQAEGSLSVPEFFALAIAPFRGGAAQIVLCRLRFRAERGAAKFEYSLIRPHKIVEHAWKLVAADISAATGEEVLLGSITIPSRK